MENVLEVVNIQMYLFFHCILLKQLQGEGGVITTNNKEIYKDLLRLRSHGINKGSDKLLNKEFAYTGNKKTYGTEMTELGYRYRITDIQCALALSQLKKG